MTTANGILDASALDDLGGALASALLPRKSAVFGRRVLFLGDSITNRANAETAAGGFVDQALEMAGYGYQQLGRGSTVAGYPGERSDQIAARLPALLAAAPYDVVHIMAGTNDVGQGATMVAYSTAMLSAFSLCRRRGIALMVSTIPPRHVNAAPTADQRKAQDAFNAWLRLVVPQYGTLCDSNVLLADPLTGYMLGTYNSDNIHPNSRGHRQLALPIAAALRANRARQILSGFSAFNVIANPYFGANATGWFEQPGGAGAAAAYSFVDDTTGVLAQGRWREMDLDGSAQGGASNRTYATSLGNVGPSEAIRTGDLVALCGKMQLIDSSGDWENYGPGGAGGGASISALLVTNAAVAMSGWDSPTQGLGYRSAVGQYDYEFVRLAVIPAGPTGLSLWTRLTVPAGRHYKLRLGEMGLLNLTTSGLSAVEPFGP